MRLSKSDAALLGLEFGDLVKIRSFAGGTAYAKCAYIHPSEETTYSGKVQIETMTLNSIGIRPENLHATVTISKVSKKDLATSVTVEPVYDPRAVEPRKVDPRFVSIMLEDKPLWKGAVILVPREGKVEIYSVTSVEPPPVALGTMLTKVTMGGEKQTESSKSSPISKLYQFHLAIYFNREVADYEALAKVLTNRGFTVPAGFRSATINSSLAGTDRDLMRHSPPDPSMRSPPPLQFGKIQVHGESATEPYGRVLRIGSIVGNIHLENDTTLQDLERGLPLIAEVLEKDLHVDFQKDLETLELNVSYLVDTGKDSRPVLDSLKRLPNDLEVMRLYGRKDGSRGRIVLYPFPNISDRSLTPSGLVEIGVHPMNTINMTADYIADFKYERIPLSEVVRLVLSSAGKALSIVSILERESANKQ